MAAAAEEEDVDMQTTQPAKGVAAPKREPPHSMSGVTEMLLKDCFRGLRGRKMTDPPSQLTMAANYQVATEHMSRIMLEHDVHNRSLAEGSSVISKGKCEMMSPFSFFRDWTFFCGAPKQGQGDGAAHPGLAVRTPPQRISAAALAWRELNVVYVPPGNSIDAPPGEIEARVQREDVAQVCEFVQLFKKFALGEDDDDDWPSPADFLAGEEGECIKVSHLLAMCEALPRQFQFPAAGDEPDCSGGGGEIGDDGPVVPVTVDVGSIKTATALFAYVEEGFSPLLLWGAPAYQDLRKKTWGGEFGAESKKLTQLYGAYCYLRLKNLEGELTSHGLGNKQVLAKKAAALLGRNIRSESEYSGLQDSALVAKYSDAETWYDVAKQVYEERTPPQAQQPALV